MLSWLSVAVTLVLLGVFAVQIGTFESLKPTQRPAQTPAVGADETKVQTSTITGFDKDSQPYSVNAADAVQDSKEPNLVHLKTVSATLKRTSGENLRLDANAARYDRDAEILDLNGNVNVVSPDRFTAIMSTAQVTLKDKRFRSEVPVSVALRNGTIDARGVEITDDGDRILFFNGVKAKFNQAKQGSAQP
ncbi:MAG: LPS export ABC transporter periplasmic protein LptC [Parvibaculaceae bacterium]